MQFCSHSPTTSRLPHVPSVAQRKAPAVTSGFAPGLKCSVPVAAALARRIFQRSFSCRARTDAGFRTWCSVGSEKTSRRAAGSPSSVGAHALIWIAGLTEEEVRRAAQGAVKTGYDTLELPIFDPDNTDSAMIKRVLEEYNLKATASLGLPFDCDVSSSDPDIVARGEARLEKVLNVGASFGMRHLCGILYSGFGKYTAPPTLVGREHSVNAMRRLGRRAADSGVQVNLEVVNRYESNLLNTASQAVAFCKDVDDPNVKVHLDTYHMNIEERSFSDAVHTCGEMLGYVHLGESHRGYLGTGTVAWSEFFTALQGIGYTGPMTFESFSNKVVAPYCVDALCVWRNLWEDSDDLAQASRTFIDKQWMASGSFPE